MIMIWIILILNFIVSMKWILAIFLFIYYFKQELRELFKELANKLKDMKSFESSVGKATFFGQPLGSELKPDTTNFNENGERSEKSKKEGAYNKNFNGYNKGFGPFELKTVIEEGNIIEKQIIDRKCSESDAIGMLIYSLAHQNLHNRFLIFDRFITRSQISTLEYLNANVLPVPTEKFRKFCDKLAGEEDGYTYDSFVSWMVDWKLIEKSARGFIIAINGRDYLSFRARAGSNVFQPLSTPWQEIAATLD